MIKKYSKLRKTYTCFPDKISQWGPNFREGFTRLGLLKPFMAENAAVYFLTATATIEDMRVKNKNDIRLSTLFYVSDCL